VFLAKWRGFTVLHLNPIPRFEKKVRIAAVFYAQKNKLLKFISAMAVSSKRAVCTTLHKTVMPTKVLVVLPS
jgi:hypothetical protein